MAKRAAYPSKRQDQYIVRFPDGMRDHLKALAKANRRSMNSEIICALEAWMAAAGGKFGDKAPAAINNAALASGASISLGKGAS